MKRKARVLGLAALLFSGCHWVNETSQKHIVHKGETALVIETGRSSAVLATSRDAVHQVAPAAEAKDQVAVERLIGAGRAFELPNGTAVRVERESFNEREVRVLSGPLEGRTGWVPFEWLRPHAEKK